MEPNAEYYHFLASLTAALALGPAFWILRGGTPAILVALSSAVLSLMVGAGKELIDLMENPWSLGPADLRTDSALDMAWNSMGACAGAVLILLTVSTVHAVVRLLAPRRQATHLGTSGIGRECLGQCIGQGKVDG